MKLARQHGRGIAVTKYGEIEVDIPLPPAIRIPYVEPCEAKYFLPDDPVPGWTIGNHLLERGRIFYASGDGVVKAYYGDQP